MTVSPAELHTIVRRYLLERHAEWTRRYGEMAPGKKGQYSATALDTFPRYQVLQAILDEVERWRPEDLPDLQTAREILAKAGMSAESPFTRPPHGDIEAHAMAEERERGIPCFRPEGSARSRSGSSEMRLRRRGVSPNTTGIHSPKHGDPMCSPCRRRLSRV